MSRKVSAEFGLVLKRRREQKGLSLQELSRRVGISAPYLMRLENGTRTMPSFSIVYDLASFLGLSIEKLSEFLDTEYEEPGDVKLEELLLYAKDLSISGKRVDSKVLEKLLDLVDSIVSSVGTSTFHVEHQILVMHSVEEFREAYHSLEN